MVLPRSALRHPLRLVTRGARGLSSVLLALLFAVGPLSASGHQLIAGAATSPCSPAALQLRLVLGAPRLRAGVSMGMALRLTNDATVACSVATGATAPTLTITRANGQTVWNNCYVRDVAGACPLVLAQRTLAPGGVYVLRASWDGRSGTPPRPVHPGVYRVVGSMPGVASRVSALLSVEG